MMEGYIFMPEADFLHIHRELRSYRRASVFFACLCIGMAYLAWKGNEKTEEKAG